ncbi:MAG TPA: tetratricopeptide repeat protein, partial [Rhizomicrobium sp.]|nr:tetratricopeptide repeat protein [Rhizomicrobium sp.]
MRRIGWWLIAAGWVVAGMHLVLAQDIGSLPRNTIAAAQNSSAPLPCSSSKLLRGILCLFVGRYDQTIAACDEVLRSDPGNLRASALRGYAHLLQKHSSRQAIADFSDVLRRDPENVALRIARARAYCQEKDYDRAIADCDEAIRIDPHCALAYAWRGVFYRQKQVIGKPLADYTMALRLDPQLRGTQCMRAEVFRRQGEIAKALDDLEEVLRSDPHNKEALIKRYLISLEDLHDYDRVIEETTRLHRSEPQEFAWYVIRSEAYLLKG